MKLITNTNTDSHSIAIRELFQDSTKIYLAVAFLKESGLNEVIKSVSDFLINGNELSIICGLDFGLTDPKALLRLYDISNTNPLLKVYIHTGDDNNAVFHPKVYMAIKELEACIIIGSANLTSGGLLNNNECSISIKAGKNTPLYNDMSQYFKILIDGATESSLLNILQYQTFYEEQQRARKVAKMKGIKHLGFFNYENLIGWLDTYRKANDINQIFAVKSHHYDEAKIILDNIADTPNITREQFIPMLERLVGSKSEDALWHSGSIYRKKTKVFDHANAYQKLVRFIRAKKDERPSFLFDGAMGLVEDIEGSGVNTVTEIMMTYNRDKFANLNKNPITVLRKEGGLALKAHRNSFNSHDYEVYCNLVTEISRYLGLRNMLEADSFFNDIYWKLEL